MRQLTAKHSNQKTPGRKQIPSGSKLKCLNRVSTLNPPPERLGIAASIEFAREADLSFLFLEWGAARRAGNDNQRSICAFEHHNYFP
jgi:hypothetical protein